MVLFLRAFHDLSAPIMPYHRCRNERRTQFRFCFPVSYEGSIGVCVLCVCGRLFCGFCFARCPKRWMGNRTDGGWPLESVSFVVCVEESKPQGGCICDTKQVQNFESKCGTSSIVSQLLGPLFLESFFFGTREAANDP